MNTRDERLRSKITRELGPQIMDALADPEVIEIMLNPDGTLWIERFTTGMEAVGRMEAPAAEALLTSVASMLDTTITKAHPIVEGELGLVDGSRFEGLLPPVAAGPTFAIRKRARIVFTLQDYLSANILDAPQLLVLREAVQQRRNILVVGGTGSGKTTLTNALIACVVETCPDDRLVILEDTVEIQCPAKNAVQLRTSPEASMNQLLKATLRLRPDRILVGEVRGPEALDLLKAWNTGHPGGIATLHANSAPAGLRRLEQLLGEATPTPMPHLIAEAIDRVAFIEKTPGGRQVRELLSVDGYADGHYLTPPAIPDCLKEDR